eukprot:TRINITY_DN65354_c0_g1_i1.p1 TRINITY_DN65354_c0_g1~~TRINITY_DN65354_c0_g1_i1.p1  ORF type:complete len:2041 (-),score=786.54 TRINITY_DN65354_c0_g1_i1:875-6241(-)
MAMQDAAAKAKEAELKAEMEKQAALEAQAEALRLAEDRAQEAAEAAERAAAAEDAKKAAEQDAASAASATEEAERRAADAAAGKDAADVEALEANERAEEAQRRMEEAIAREREKAEELRLSMEAEAQAAQEEAQARAAMDAAEREAEYAREQAALQAKHDEEARRVAEERAREAAEAKTKADEEAAAAQEHALKVATENAEADAAERVAKSVRDAEEEAARRAEEEARRLATDPTRSDKEKEEAARAAQKALDDLKRLHDENLKASSAEKEAEARRAAEEAEANARAEAAEAAAKAAAEAEIALAKGDEERRRQEEQHRREAQEHIEAARKAAAAAEEAERQAAEEEKKRHREREEAERAHQEAAAAAEKAEREAEEARRLAKQKEEEALRAAEASAKAAEEARRKAEEEAARQAALAEAEREAERSAAEKEARERAAKAAQEAEQKAREEVAKREEAERAAREAAEKALQDELQAKKDMDRALQEAEEESIQAAKSRAELEREVMQTLERAYQQKEAAVAMALAKAKKEEEEAEEAAKVSDEVKAEAAQKRRTSEIAADDLVKAVEGKTSAESQEKDASKAKQEADQFLKDAEASVTHAEILALQASVVAKNAEEEASRRAQELDNAQKKMEDAAKKQQEAQGQAAEAAEAKAEAERAANDLSTLARNAQQRGDQIRYDAAMESMEEQLERARQEGSRQAAAEREAKAAEEEGRRARKQAAEAAQASANAEAALIKASAAKESADANALKAAMHKQQAEAAAKKASAQMRAKTYAAEAARQEEQLKDMKAKAATETARSAIQKMQSVKSAITQGRRGSQIRELNRQVNDSEKQIAKMTSEHQIEMATLRVEHETALLEAQRAADDCLADANERFRERLKKVKKAALKFATGMAQEEKTLLLMKACFHIWAHLAWREISQDLFGTVNLRAASVLRIYDRHVYTPSVILLSFCVWAQVLTPRPRAEIVAIETRLHTKHFMENFFLRTGTLFAKVTKEQVLYLWSEICKVASRRKEIRLRARLGGEVSHRTFLGVHMQAMLRTWWFRAKQTLLLLRQRAVMCQQSFCVSELQHMLAVVSICTWAFLTWSKWWRSEREHRQAMQLRRFQLETTLVLLAKVATWRLLPLVFGYWVQQTNINKDLQKKKEDTVQQTIGFLRGKKLEMNHAGWWAFNTWLATVESIVVMRTHEKELAEENAKARRQGKAVSDMLVVIANANFIMLIFELWCWSVDAIRAARRADQSMQLLRESMGSQLRRASDLQAVFAGQRMMWLFHGAWRTAVAIRKLEAAQGSAPRRPAKQPEMFMLDSEDERETYEAAPWQSIGNVMQHLPKNPGQASEMKKDLELVRLAGVAIDGVDQQEEWRLRLGPVLEALVAVRSRNWRLACDLRSSVESALLHLGELHEGMLLLLEQMARKVLRPASEPAESWHPQGGWLADVARLARQAKQLQGNLDVLTKQWQPLSQALLEATAAAVRVVLDSRVLEALAEDDELVDANIDDASRKILDLLQDELQELRRDEEKLRVACGGFLGRSAAAKKDLRALAEARRDLPVYDEKMQPSQAAALEQEATALDAGGEQAKTLLQALTASVEYLDTDARGLLQYLDNSEVLRAGVDAAASSPQPEFQADTLLPASPQGFTSAAPSGRSGFAGSSVAATATPRRRLEFLPVSPVQMEVPSAITAGLEAIGRIISARSCEYLLRQVWRAWFVWVQLLRRLRVQARPAVQHPLIAAGEDESRALQPLVDRWGPLEETLLPQMRPRTPSGSPAVQRFLDMPLPPPPEPPPGDPT